MMTFVTWDSFVSFFCNSINVSIRDSILNCQFFFKHEIRRIETRLQAARVSDRNRCKKPDEISEKFDISKFRKDILLQIAMKKKKTHCENSDAI